MMRQLPIDSVDCFTLKLLKHISLCAFNHPDTVASKDGRQRDYGLDMLWSWMQDDAGVSPQTKVEAMQCLSDLLSTKRIHHRVWQFMKACVENLAKGKSVVQSLELLQVKREIHHC